jgi:uncharacterized protein
MIFKQYISDKYETFCEFRRIYSKKKRKGTTRMPTKDERLLAAVIYIISFFTVFIGPIVIWLLKKDDSEFIDYHGKEYLNFLISYFVYGTVSGILTVVLIGFVLLPVVGILVFIFTILGAIKAYEGENYRIPTIFRLIK